MPPATTARTLETSLPRPAVAVAAVLLLAAPAAAVAAAAGSAHAATSDTPHPEWVDANGPYRDFDISPQNIQTGGCLIRFSSPDGSPSLYSNGAHLCVGADAVEIDSSGALWVGLTQKGTIITTTAQTDETLTACGIQAGASGGGSWLRITLYGSQQGRVLNVTDPTDRNRVKGTCSNLWLGWTEARARG